MLVKSQNDIQEAIEFAASIEGVEGAVVIMADKIGVWGKIELVKT